LAVFFEVLPVIQVAPVAGVVIDRLPRKAVLVGADLTRTVLVLALLLTNSLWQIYAIILMLTKVLLDMHLSVTIIHPLSSPPRGEGRI